MSKQDIEKRLGFAAQGVKETTRTGAKAKMATGEPDLRSFRLPGEIAAVRKKIDEYTKALNNDLRSGKYTNAAARCKAIGAMYSSGGGSLSLFYEEYADALKNRGYARSGVKTKMETPMRVALTPMHTRAEQGYENFIAVLMKFGGITREQALKAFKAFKDAKVLVTKDQYMGGGITVKHGAFMERDVIRRAAGLPEESPRPGAKAKA